MNIDYIGLNINGWIVKEVKKQSQNNRIRTFLICECPNCKREKIIRADKRNLVGICNCRKVKKETKVNQEKIINQKWEKIKSSDIFINKEEFIQFYNQKGGGKFYKKNNNKPFSKVNYIFGSYQDVKEYYIKKRKEKEIKRKKVIEYLNGLKLDSYTTQCPFCGAISTYINTCPICKMRYYEDNTDLVYEKNNKEKIEEEDNQYTEIYNHFSCFNNEKKSYIPIKDIKAIYFDNFNLITRIGITRVNKIDCKNQGVIGDFQGIGKDGKTFIIDNVFQNYGNTPFIFKDDEKLDSQKIHYFDFNNIYTYVVLEKNNITDSFILSLYRNGKKIKSIYDVIELWGHR